VVEFLSTGGAGDVDFDEFAAQQVDADEIQPPLAKPRGDSLDDATIRLLHSGGQRAAA